MNINCDTMSRFWYINTFVRSSYSHFSLVKEGLPSWFATLSFVWFTPVFALFIVSIWHQSGCSVSYYSLLTCSDILCRSCPDSLSESLNLASSNWLEVRSTELNLWWGWRGCWEDDVEYGEAAAEESSTTGGNLMDREELEGSAGKNPNCDERWETEEELEWECACTCESSSRVMRM